MFSNGDTYAADGSCLVEDLFRANKLRYVGVQNFSPEKHVVSQMVLSDNISELQYLRIAQDGAKYSVALDTSKETPLNLRIFEVKTGNDGDVSYGIIKGSGGVEDTEWAGKHLLNVPGKK